MLEQVPVGRDRPTRPAIKSAEPTYRDLDLPEAETTRAKIARFG